MPFDENFNVTDIILRYRCYLYGYTKTDLFKCKQSFMFHSSHWAIKGQVKC